MKQKWVEVKAGESEQKIQTLLNMGWEVKMMTSAPYSGTGSQFGGGTPPVCFVYLTLED